MPIISASRRFRRVAAGLALLVAGGGTAPAAPSPFAGPPPIPAGDARFWFYRVFFPDDTRDMPAISMNGTPIGYAVAGVSFYRDLPAGQYHITVQSDGLDYDQSRDVATVPGQNFYVKIASLPSWQESSRGRYHGGTYYVMIVAPRLAALEVPQTSYSGGE